jgi:hypothetical protein
MQHAWMRFCFILVFVSTCGAARADSSAGKNAARQELWVVNTRSAPRCGDLEAGFAQVTYARLEHCGDCGQPCVDASALHQGDDPAVPLTILIHGNRTDATDAIDRGWTYFHRMQQQAEGRAFRLVVWSWPADRIGMRPRPDAQIKAEWSDADSYYIARFMQQTRPGVPVCLVGYSYGARAAGGALELLAGGEICGNRLPPETFKQPEPARPIRVMLVAAAIDDAWFCPGCRYGEASALVQRMLITEDCLDRALRFYVRLYGRHGPPALGSVGPACDDEKFEPVDVACWVGKKHDWYLYETAEPVDQRRPWYTFLKDEQ